MTAGGTREPLDPVRFLGNRSSGKQGHALAVAAAERGARVTLVTSAPADLPGIRVVAVETALQLREAVHAAAEEADVVVMAAAVADFRPASYASTKIKKTHADEADGSADASAPVLTLVRNPDILAELVERRGGAGSPVVVGFAAETGDAQGSVLDHGRAKLERKGCDVLVVNEVGTDKTFGRDDNTVHILRQGLAEPVCEIGPASKDVIAHAVLDVVLDRPAVLTPLLPFTAALVASYGSSDAALLDALTGRIPPEGRLPVDLPRSMEQVRHHAEDVAGYDDPLFAFGHGLSS